MIEPRLGICLSPDFGKLQLRNFPKSGDSCKPEFVAQYFSTCQVTY